MRTTIKLLVALALAFATFNQHTTAAAAEVFKFKGQGVSAFFSSTDSSGCILTNVIIIASEDSFQTMPDPEETTSWIELAISQYDECAQTELLDAEGFASLADSDLRISKKLDLATLDTTVNVEEVPSPMKISPSPSTPPAVTSTATLMVRPDLLKLQVPYQMGRRISLRNYL